MSRVEVLPNRSLEVVSPAVREAVNRIIAGMASEGWKAVQCDTLRTPERQSFLYGKGRTPEQCIEAKVDASYAWPTCPDGIVTKAANPYKTWHGFGLAVDIVQDDATPWIAPQAFWNRLGWHASANKMFWGGAWVNLLDLPHTQWSRCPNGPSVEDRMLLEKSGIEAVWKKYGAS